MSMKPTFREFVIASPYTLPFWVLLVLFCYRIANDNWESAPPAIQVSLVVFLAVWVIQTVRLVPKVWWYHYEKAKHARAGRDPEVVRTQQRTNLKQFVLLLCLGGWFVSLWWLTENSYDANPNDYLTVLAVCVGLTIAAGIVLYLRVPTKVRHRVKAAITTPESQFIVSWCLPVPKHGTKNDALQLPDYCQLLFASPKQQLQQEQDPRNFADTRTTFTYR